MTNNNDDSCVQPRDKLNMEAARVFQVFYGRKGFNWWWDGIDEDTQLEIVEELNVACSSYD